MSKKKSYGYVKNLQFYREAFFEGDLQNATLNILAMLISHCDKYGYTKYFSIDRVAEKKGVSRQGIQNQINKLIKARYIIRVERLGQTNEYYINFEKFSAPATQLDCPSSETIPATQLSCVGATFKVADHATQPDCTKRTIENLRKPFSDRNDYFHGLIESKLGAAIHNFWFKDLFWDGSNILVAPSRFIKDWVSNNYLEDPIKLYFPEIDHIEVRSIC